MSPPETNRRLLSWWWTLTLLVFSDTMAIAIGLVAAHQVRYLQGLETPFAQGAPVLPLIYLWPLGLVWLAVFKTFGLYERENLVSGIGEYRRVVNAGVLTTLAVIVFAYVRVQPFISRGFLLVSLASVVFCAILGRFWVRRLIYAQCAAGRPLERVIVVGSSRHAASVAAQLMDNVSASAQVVGFLSEYLPRGARVIRDLTVLGEPLELEKVADKYGATRALVVESGLSWESLQAMVRLMHRRQAMAISLVPGMLDLHATQMRPQQMGPVFALVPHAARIVGAEAMFKRGLDIALGAIGALVAIPLLAMMALVGILQGSPPRLRRQLVLGPTRTIVIRTLDGPSWAVRAHLSRLPNLLNVLTGNMSLIGPRPIPVDQAAKYSESIAILEAAKPGFIGPWWLVGKSEPESMVEELAYDLHYLRNYSIWLDLHMLVQVGRSIFRRGRGPEFRGLGRDTVVIPGGRR